MKKKFRGSSHVRRDLLALAKVVRPDQLLDGYKILCRLRQSKAGHNFYDHQLLCLVMVRLAPPVLMVDAPWAPDTYTTSRLYRPGTPMVVAPTFVHRAPEDLSECTLKLMKAREAGVGEFEIRSDFRTQLTGGS